MSRDGVSRLLLVLVALAGVAAAVRLTSAHDDRHGFVDFGDDWDVDRLRWEAFRLERPAAVTVDAVGSFDTDTSLAARGWIVRRADRAVVWEMTPSAARRERGSLAAVTDTLRLGAGTYDAYFSTFGDPDRETLEGGSLGERLGALLRFGAEPWHSDRDEWRLRLHVDPDAAERLDRERIEDAAPAGPGLVWAAGPAEDSEVRAQFFEVERPVVLRLYANGEIEPGEVHDTGWIEDVRTGRRAWTMTRANTAPGGGADRNRRFEGTLKLAPGLYRAAFETDSRHAFRDWRRPPPLDPAGWGLFAFAEPAADASALTGIDPFDRFPAVAAIERVGNDRVEAAAFTLTDSLRVWLHAEGERLHRTWYDRAWLTRDGETVWEMDRDGGLPAGGDGKNRLVETALALGPGAYTLHYETDDSHAYDDWNEDPPDHPERWGVTLFALSPGFEPVAVTRTGEVNAATMFNGDVPPPPDALGDDVAALPLRLAPVGNDYELARAFRLSEETPLAVYALGEIIRDDRYDYGWITDADGAIVWEMTRENTEPAGGADKNRRFKGTVTLPAGAYTLRYKTDGSHAYGDFGSPPNDPRAWGIAVERASDAPPLPPPTPPLPGDEDAGDRLETAPPPPPEPSPANPDSAQA